MNAGRIEASVFLQFAVCCFGRSKNPVLCRFFCPGSGGKYLLQSSFPCIFGFIQPDDTVSIGESAVLCHFSDHSIGNLKISNLSVRNLCNDISKSRRKEISGIQVVFDLYAKPVSKRHLADCCRNTVTVKRICGQDSARADIFCKFTILLHHFFVDRYVVIIGLDPQPYQLAAGLLKLRCDDVFFFCHIHGKGYQCGRHINIFESTGHTVLSSDGRQPESELCVICSKERRKRLAPSVRIFCHTAEILLEGKPDLRIISSGSHDLCNGFCHSINGSVIRAPGGKVGIKSVTHHRHGVAVSFQHRKFCHHSLSLCHLIFTAVGHEDRSGSDRTVKHLHQSLLGAYVQIFQGIHPLLFYVFYFLSGKNGILPVRNINSHCSLLMSAVGIQESAGKIDDLFSSPAEHQPGFFCYNSHSGSLQVFFGSIRHKCIGVFGIYHNRHTFLGFGNSNLGSVKSRIFFRHFIKIYSQAVSQLSDGNGYAACSKVVTFFDQPADFFSAEQSLDLALCRRISLLDLRAAGGGGLFGMYLGGSGRSAAAVTAGASAQQDDDISRIRSLADHGSSWSRAKHRSDLHTFCYIVGMIDFFHRAGGKADLVAIGTISMGRLSYQFLLGKLALQGIFCRNSGICRSGHTHRLIYIGSAGQRITDGAAKTGSRPSERLDLCRMVVSLVLEIHQPFFFHAVHCYRHNDTAGIDLFRFFLIFQFSFSL